MKVCKVGNAELLDQPFQRTAMQLIERHKAVFGMPPHLIHRRHISLPPGIDQRGPIGGDAVRFRPAREVSDQTAAPIDDGAEHIEHHRLHRV